MMKPKKLKPCPFCGVEPIVDAFRADYTKLGGGECNQFSIGCQELGCRASVVTRCGAGRYTGEQADRNISDEQAFSEILDRWNRRVK